MAVGFVFFQREMRKIKSDFLKIFFQKNTLGRNSLSAYWLILIKKVCFKKTQQTK